MFLDSGTTVTAVAGALAAHGAGMRLSTLTTSLGVASTLADVPGIDCVLLGGQLRRVDGALVGALALENLQRFTFGLAFIGVSGFSDVGISVGSLAEAAVKAEAIERARRVVLALDHTKVGTTDFARISGLDVIDVVVMDKTTPAVEELCAGYDIELIAAGMSISNVARFCSDHFRLGLTCVMTGVTIAPTRQYPCRANGFSVETRRVAPVSEERCNAKVSPSRAGQPASAHRRPESVPRRRR